MRDHRTSGSCSKTSILLASLGIAVVVCALGNVLVGDTRLLAPHKVNAARAQQHSAKSNILSSSLYDYSVYNNQLAIWNDTLICARELRDIFARQDCFLHQQRYPGEESACVAAPLVQYAYMWGQGFGRILQHAVKSCFLAAQLHRPCVIDLVRDRFFNLQSFLSVGPFDWRTGRRLLTARQQTEIRQALNLMPECLQKGHGWEKLPTDKMKRLSSSYESVLPMVWGKDAVSSLAIQTHVNTWNATNGPYAHKVLLAPNFGDAWYGYGREPVNVARLWNLRHRTCTANRVTTLLQNAMFVPTSLAYELHQERMTRVLPRVEESSEPTRYGAIHLRMFILNRDVYHMNVMAPQIVAGLQDCFEKLGPSAPDHWWLIADDIEVAKTVTEQLPSVYSYVQSFDDISNPSLVKGNHSGSALNRKFGQEALAPSFLDWMTLHQSEVALITHDSAYGETGARGQGKIRGSTCGGKVQKPDGRVSFPLFTVFLHPS